MCMTGEGRPTSDRERRDPGRAHTRPGGRRAASGPQTSEVRDGCGSGVVANRRLRWNGRWMREDVERHGATGLLRRLIHLVP